MKYSMRLSLIPVLVFLAAGHGLVYAQVAEVGLINQLAGEASYANAAGVQTRAQAFMRVRQGDRFVIAAGTVMSIVYFKGARQEKWQGPATLRAGIESSDLVSGKAPAVSKLPVAVPEKIARIPDLVQGARLGGVSVRGFSNRRPPGTTPDEVTQARATYKEWREQASADDVTPELYLLSVLQEHGYIDDLGPVGEEMLRRQPGNADIHELAQWAIRRANAPK